MNVDQYRLSSFCRN